MCHILREIRFRSVLLVAIVVWVILAAVWYLTLGWDPTPAVRPLTRAASTVGPAAHRTKAPVESEANAVMEPSTIEGVEVEVRPAAPPAEPLSASPPRPVAGRGGVVLQAGAFRHEDAARARLRNLEARGHPVRLDSASADGLVRILVGPFPSQAEARRVQKLLEADGIGSFVRSVE